MLLAFDAIAIVAAVAWAAGLTVLGALVAPVIFGSGDLHAPDLMTDIFVRFDKLAVVCAAILVLREAASFVVPAFRRNTRPAQTTLAIVLGLCAAAQALYLTPTIARMHEQGVRPEIGAAGHRFGQLHRASEHLGKLTVALALGYAVLVLVERRRAGRPLPTIEV